MLQVLITHYHALTVRGGGGGGGGVISAHQIEVPTQVQLPGCQATPHYYYITYDYKYSTQI